MSAKPVATTFNDELPFAIDRKCDLQKLLSHKYTESKRFFRVKVGQKKKTNKRCAFQHTIYCDQDRRERLAVYKEGDSVVCYDLQNGKKVLNFTAWPNRVVKSITYASEVPEAVPFDAPAVVPVEVPKDVPAALPKEEPVAVAV
jgi:hypothetical protein